MSRTEEQVTGQSRVGNLAVTSAETTSPDVVYVVREGENNEELRYSLRTLDNLPHNKVYIVGYKPSWVENVIHITNKQGPNPQENVNRGLQLISEDKRINDFVFMNDDFFIMHPIGGIPEWYQGSLNERIILYKQSHNYVQAFSLETTQRELKRMGVEAPLSWELHVPMNMNRKKLRKMFKATELELFAIRPRTLYANYNNVRGIKHNDVKGLSSKKEIFISTAGEFRTSRAAKLICGSRPDRSPYEKIHSSL